MRSRAFLALAARAGQDPPARGRNPLAHGFGLVALAVMVPMIYLSGLMFPIENMPAFCRALTYAVPLRYYAAILRGVFLKGSGLAVLWPETLALCAFALGTGAAAALRFRKNLE